MNLVALTANTCLPPPIAKYVGHSSYWDNVYKVSQSIARINCGRSKCHVALSVFLLRRRATQTSRLLVGISLLGGNRRDSLSRWNGTLSSHPRLSHFGRVHAKGGHTLRENMFLPSKHLLSARYAMLPLRTLLRTLSLLKALTSRLLRTLLRSTSVKEPSKNPSKNPSKKRIVA